MAATALPGPGGRDRRPAVRGPGATRRGPLRRAGAAPVAGHAGPRRTRAAAHPGGRARAGVGRTDRGSGCPGGPGFGAGLAATRPPRQRRAGLRHPRGTDRPPR